MRSEEIRALFDQGGPVLWANVGVAALLALTLWQDAPHDRLLGWLAAIVLLSAARGLFQRRYRRAQPGAAELERWGRGFVLGSILSGALWGAAGVLFFVSGSALAQGLLTFAIGGMTAAAAGTLSCHLPAFFGYFVCALAPLTIRALAEGDRVHLGMGAMLLTYAVGMQRVARNNHGAFERAFRLGIENAELLQAADKLAGGLAHDFNSLLTVIINNARLMKESQALDEQGELAAEEMLEAAQRGAALIRKLVAGSRRQQPEPPLFSLNPGESPAPALVTRKRLRGPQGATILVVDDEPTLRSVIRRSLVHDGYSVLVAEDAERALTVARNHTQAIHLLITDVVMPGLTGLELWRQLLSERPGLSVLFISGFTFEESLPACDLELGTAYLPKPFDTKELSAKVRELLVASEKNSASIKTSV